MKDPRPRARCVACSKVIIMGRDNNNLILIQGPPILCDDYAGINSVNAIGSYGYHYNEGKKLK
jgi:hypothetical protein